MWFPNIADVFLKDETDWEEIDALIVESYRTLAPKALAARVERPRR